MWEECLSDSWTNRKFSDFLEIEKYVVPVKVDGIDYQLRTKLTGHLAFFG